MKNKEMFKKVLRNELIKEINKNIEIKNNKKYFHKKKLMKITNKILKKYYNELCIFYKNNNKYQIKENIINTILGYLMFNNIYYCYDLKYN